jgi:hypothetical protein
MTRIGDKYKIETGPDGRMRVVGDTKAAEAKLDMSTRIAKRANRGKPKLASRSKAQTVPELERVDKCNS